MLITGASGVVGSDLVKFFSKYRKVYALYRKKNRVIDNLKNKNIIWVKQDIGKEISLNIKPKIIIHCAVTHSLSDKRNYSNYMDSNIIGLKNVIQFAKKKGVKRFIHLSSINVYGDIKTKILDENNPFLNPDLLGTCKIFMEKIISIQNLHYLNIRLPGIVGYQINDTRRPWLNRIINLLKNNKKIEIFNSEKNFNNIIDSYEIFKFLKTIINQNFKSNTFNLSASKPIKIKKMILNIKKKLNSSSKVIFKKKKAKYFLISNKLVLKNFKYHSSSTEKILNRYLSNFQTRNNFVIKK